MYKYLLFDIDGTLMDFDHDKDYAFRRMYSLSGLEAAKPLTDELISVYDACNERWWRRFELGLCTKPELYNNRFSEFFIEADLPRADPNWINALYFGALGETGTLFPGAEALLSTLHTHFDIYIITNGNADSQKTRMEHSGILRYIKDSFISEAAGAAKPDKRYFDYVLEYIPGARPKDCIVIGDSLSSDMCGAVNAGMDSVWFNPQHAENPQGIPVTYEVENYSALLHLLLPGQEDEKH